MRRFGPSVLALLVASVTLSGCFGSKDGDEGHDDEQDPADFGTDTFDTALGNEGYRVTGSLTGTATALADTSAVQLDILDEYASDASGTDKATFILQADEPNFSIYASLKEMLSGDELDDATLDLLGGVAQNIDVFGASGFGPDALPQAEAYLVAVGKAQLRLNDNPLPQYEPVLVVVSQGIRDEELVLLAAPDEHDLEFHVIFPGEMIGDPIEGLDDEFLYYYFESVSVDHLTDDQILDVGRGLRAPPTVNVPPVAVAQILVDGVAASSGVREGDDPLTVTFDGTSSSDEDGQIVVWVWYVAHLNTTGEYEDPEENATVTGGQRAYNFTEPGEWLVQLVVRDNSGGVANFTVTFWVDQHRVINGKKSIHSDYAGGYASCFPSVNCFDHEVVVGYGIQKAKFTYVAGTGQVPQTHIDLYKPGQTTPNPPGEDGDTPTQAGTVNDPLEVTDKTKLAPPGRYKVLVWWDAGANVTYKLDVELTYKLSVADAGGDGSSNASLPPLPPLDETVYVSTKRTWWN